MGKVDLILHNGKITTLDSKNPEVSAIAIKNGCILACGDETTIMKLASKDTQLIDCHDRRVLPGLNDSHLHLIRGGLNYNLELRWDGVPSLALALNMLRDQVLRTPAPQWVRVVGGWSEFQFIEKRMPTLEEINQLAPDTPVFILHLYDRALLNAAALRAVGYTKDTPNPIGGEIQRDRHGNPTGLLIAKPNAMILYATLAKGPKLPLEYQINSTRHFMRELNRLGVTSVIDAGGGFQNYPEDYQVIDQLHTENQLTVRIAYNLFTQNPGGELEDFKRWTQMIKPYQGSDYYRVNGAGEMLVFSAADFEDFLEPRPDLSLSVEDQLHQVVSHLAEHNWPFRLHATYNESIERALPIFEAVNREIPFQMRWIFDHAETITPKNIERVRALGGGFAIQNRMAFQGEYFIDRYGQEAANNSPPIQEMIRQGAPVGAGTDATRVSSFNPWLSLHWLVTGKTIGGTNLYLENNLVDRETALKLYTLGSSWISKEEDVKGCLKAGMYADLIILNDDYMKIPAEKIKKIESIMTIVGGKIVYASQDYKEHDLEILPVMPDWSPVNYLGGYYQDGHLINAQKPHIHSHQCALNKLKIHPAWTLECDCFAF